MTATGHAAGLYRLVEDAVRTCGDFRIHPQKSRIAFITTMTFAAVHLARDWVDVSFIAPTPIDDERIRSLVCYGPTTFGHTVRIVGPSDIDDQMIAWLCIAKRRGDQETLDAHASVEPAVGRVLRLLTVPVRTDVVDRAGVLTLRVPSYVLDLFELHHSLLARLKGIELAAAIEGVDRDRWLDFSGGLEQVGLGEGDAIDVTFRSTA